MQEDLIQFVSYEWTIRLGREPNPVFTTVAARPHRRSRRRLRRAPP